MEPETGSSETLCQEIRAQSERDAEAVLEQARKESARLSEEAGKRADRVREEIMEKAGAQAKAVRKKILSGVHLEIKKQRMAVQEDAIKEVTASLRKKLLDFRAGDDYGDFLEKMIIEGAASLNGGRLIIIPGDRERELLTESRLKRIADSLKERYKTIALSLSEDSLAEAGVEMTTEDRRIRFDNRFSTRLQRMDHHIRLQVNTFLENVSGDKKQ